MKIKCCQVLYGTGRGCLCVDRMPVVHMRVRYKGKTVAWARGGATRQPYYVAINNPPDIQVGSSNDISLLLETAYQLLPTYLIITPLFLIHPFIPPSQ